MVKWGDVAFAVSEAAGVAVLHAWGAPWAAAAAAVAGVLTFTWGVAAVAEKWC